MVLGDTGSVGGDGLRTQGDSAECTRWEESRQLKPELDGVVTYLRRPL